MSDRALRWLAWALLAFALACAVAGIVITVATDRTLENGIFPLLATLTFSIVGAIVAAGQPRNAIGWLLVAIGVGGGLGLATSALYEWDRPNPGTVPGAAVYAWIDGTLWLVWIGFLVPRVMLLFPDGRPPSPRWRVVSVVQYTILAGLLVAGLKPGPIHDYEEYDNPFGVGPLSRLDGLPSQWGIFGGALFAFATLGAAVSLIVRFHHSRGVERLQLKWVTWAVGVTAALWLAGSVVRSPVMRVLEPLQLLALCLAPISVGIAVLRYRLYEIDRVISRTLVYGTLTALLGGAYVGLVLAGQALFSSFAGGSNLAIAVSTLVVAALFLPMRSRVQRFVDRRFYRRRYDAQRTLEDFGARLREQIDLGTLRIELHEVVEETMQPAHVALWLRTGEAAR